MQKKLLSILLSLAMVITMMPMASMTAFAEEKTVTTWSGLQDAIDNADAGDTIKLGANISAGSGDDESISVNKALTLDLNGYMLDINVETSQNYGSVIYVGEDGDLTIKDSQNLSASAHDIYSCNGEDYNYAHWFTYKPDGYDDEAEEDKKHISINGGLITGAYGGYDCDGGGIYIDTGAQVTLQSGTIAGNVADNDGGGVFVGEGAKFIMNGGTISYNECSYGGGVAVGSRWTSVNKAEFILNGGTVSNNIAWTGGGGVYVSAYPQDFGGSYFTMTGGTVSNNESYYYGGGVALEDCDAYAYSSTINAIIMKITGGTITNNYCGTYGGGVFFCAEYEHGSVTLGGEAVISGNWCGNQQDDHADNFHIGVYPADTDHQWGIHAQDDVGFFKFDEDSTPTEGMNVGISLATSTGDLTATLDSIPEGITNYLYSDSTDYMVSADGEKVFLTDNIYPVLYCNDGTNAMWKCEFGDNNVPKALPTRENYDFDGWYTAKTGGDLVHNGTEFKNDYTLFEAKEKYYAHWKETPKTPTIYQISANAPESVFTATETQNGEASFTISPKTLGNLGYSHVRVKVEVDKPDGSNPLIYDSTDKNKINIANSYIGKTDGFKISNDYNKTTQLIMKFDKPGNYKITYSLVNLDKGEEVLCSTTTTVKAKEHSTYKFVINEPDTLVANQEYGLGDVTLRYVNNNWVGYDKVCVKVELSAQPASSDPELYVSTDHSKTNLLTSGYLGSSEGFELTSNYNEKTPLTVKFDKDGEYILKFTLLDMNDGNKVICEATKTIKVNPALNCKVEINGTKAVGYTLSADVTELKTGVGVTYQWYRCATSQDAGTVITPATKATYKATDYDIGYFLKCRVSASADSGYGGYVEAITSGVIKKAFSGKPTITVGARNEYAPRPGEQIIASITNTGEVNHDNVTFQWYRCDTAGSVGTAIEGATSDRYTPTEEDLGKYLKVEITAKDICECGGSIMSDATAKVKNPPSISDEPEVTDTTVTLPKSETTPNNFEYSIDGENWTDKYEYTGLSAESMYTYYIREKAPQGGSPTAATVVTVYTAFAKPQAGEGYTIDYINEKINIQAGYEISTWSDDFGFDKGVMTPDESGNVAIIPGKYYYVRKATKAVSDNAIPASAAMSFIKARPATPEQSELYSKSSYSITVKAESGQEYSIDDGATWVTDGSKGDRDSRKGTITFTGLTAGTTYYVVTRKTAVTTPGSEAFASEISMALSVTTDSGSSPSPTPGPEPTSAEEYTVPVGGDSSLKVEATIENGKAKVKEITKKDLEEFVEKVDGKTEIDSIELDFTQAKQEVKSVEFTKTTLENIQEVLESKENNISKLVVKMSEGTVSLDAKALEAVTEQAKGDTIILVVDKTQNEKLSEAKQETLKAYNVNKTFEAYFESNGQRIHDFKGGVATVSMKFEPTQGSNTKNYKIYYLDDNAKMHKYATKYENGMLVFATTHFSDYVIVYDGKTDVLLAQAKSSKGKIALSWNGLDNVTKYVVYGARCGHDYKKLTSTTGKSYTVKRASSQRLKAHKVYKFYVVAYDAVGNKISSRSIHCIYKNTNARFGNVKSIKAKISKLTLKVGDSKTVGAKYKMYAGKKHLKRTHGPALKFFSNNTDVAKVSENGKVTAVGAGTATIYIQDLGGKYTKTAVTVK